MRTTIIRIHWSVQYVLALVLASLLLPHRLLDVSAMIYEPTFKTRPWAEFMVTVMLMPGRHECFYQEASSGDVMNFEYQLAGKDNRPSLSGMVKAPSGMVIHENSNAIMGTFTHSATLSGPYEFCIKNENQKYFVKYVKLYLSIMNTRRMDAYYKVEESLQKSVGNISKALQTVNMAVRVMRRYQQTSGIRAKRDEELIQANQRYVMTWSTLQCAVIVGAAAVQIYVVKGLFTTPKLTPNQKPRC